MAAASRELLDLQEALRDQYAIERELGRGGMGVVFLGRDLKLDRHVAIKALPLHLADDERVRERFLREARTAARLSHPNIVPIHRADEIEGRVFFVMGFVDGESLAQRVAARGPLPSPEVVAILCDVGSALSEAHRHGIVHRDIKAENILIDQRTGRALVTDFGIARVAEAAPLTATGLLLGTVQYMSPEHVVGEAVDARSDIYSLGVVAFHALTGRFPFQSESASAVLVAHVTKEPPKIRDVASSISPALADVVDRCLAKDPAQRFQSAGEVVSALSRLPSTAPPPLVAQGTRADAEDERDREDVLLSDREARVVWERAAKLQAQATGTVSAPVIPERDGTRQPISPSSAYRLDVVRESAREAGISTEYVDRALAERGLTERAPSPLPPSPAPATPMEIRDVRLRPISPWTGAPSSIEYEVVVDGEVAERDFDRLVDTIRRAFADAGVVGSMGRSFTWSATDPKRRVHASVQVRSGRTTIRVAENMRHLVGSIFGGGVGGFGGGFAPLLGIMVSQAQGDILFAVPAGLSVVGIAYAGSRGVYKRTVRTRQEELRGLIGRLAEEAAAAIEERSDERHRPALPRR